MSPPLEPPSDAPPPTPFRLACGTECELPRQPRFHWLSNFPYLVIQVCCVLFNQCIAERLLYPRPGVQVISNGFALTNNIMVNGLCAHF